ncbi:hypothetical protein [Jiella marina]|uniref:hypothetical protein n=1 Tax=Jiella sp. LLJ827 TaxID=2917712 RepID=UPI002101C48E|nr:hypothetical protein [Jiella sp. LLJ827]MCQ0987846.1 hypothetical protein [Jiella sp. LLJ827]
MSAKTSGKAPAPESFEEDHPVAVHKETSKRLEAGRSALPPEENGDDPLEAKHRAGAFDRDFRTLDYSHLSDDEASRQRERLRRKRQHSSWQPAKAERRGDPAPVQNAQFANFGGSVVSADVIRGRSDERVPDLMPTLPGEGNGASQSEAEKAKSVHAERRRKLAFSNPDGPTPQKDQRRLPPDPLAEKHKAEKFDKDFRTVDYRHLRNTSNAAASMSAEPRAGIVEPAVSDPAGAGGEAAFRTSGAQAPLHTLTAGGDPADGLKPGEATAPAGLPGPRQGNPDDLTRIDGIGPAIEKLLFERGLYHFDQIAALRPEEAIWIEQELGFPGRIREEAWIDQARRLVEG